jgi:type II secretory pathway component GspD/PulD (secretin)
MTGQAGWEFTKVKTTGSSDDESSKAKRLTQEKPGRSRVLIVSDIPPVVDKIRTVISELDKIPHQVIIETRLMEVSRDKLRDLGIDWATGKTGAETKVIQPTPTSKKAGNVTTDLGSHELQSLVKPAVFNPLSAISGIQPYDAGLEILFQKLTGSQFEVIVHALEEDVKTNTLSAPRIMALSGQEATILVGTKYPILMQETTGAGGASPVTTVTLDYYQDIGIQLNVVPQVGADNSINMIVHPAVSSYTNTLGTNQYPIIDIREAETRVFMRDGETVVIGGLLKDMKSKGVTGVPFAKDLPLIGPLFRRDTYDNQKIDLLVFISAYVVKENQFPPAEIAKLEKRLERGPALIDDKKKKKTKKKAVDNGYMDTD